MTPKAKEHDLTPSRNPIVNPEAQKRSPIAVKRNSHYHTREVEGYDVTKCKSFLCDRYFLHHWFSNTAVCCSVFHYHRRSLELCVCVDVLHVFVCGHSRVCVLFSLCISVCVCFTAARDGGLMSFKRALFYPLMSIRTPRGLGGPAHHRRRKQPPSQPPFLALISNTHPRITVNNSHSKLSQITSLLA